MSTIDLKPTLHRLIDAINDDRVLEAHLTLLSREVDLYTGDLWDDLSADQQASIDRGLADLVAGRRKPFTDILTK
ncbi:MAG: hypothetical protein H7Z72_16520 [Bacteroidetes bacterium]|nr:hypothetical protein [Fibrella sp.]